MNKEKIEKKALKIYPENFAWVRCDEDSETYTEIDADGIKWLKVDANKTYREGYIKALLETESLPKVHGWIARDKDGLLGFYSELPERFDNIAWWCEEGCTTALSVSPESYPELTWESEPLEVELIIRKL